VLDDEVTSETSPEANDRSGNGTVASAGHEGLELDGFRREAAAS